MQPQHQPSIQQESLMSLPKLSIPPLPQQYLHYQSPYRLLYNTKSLFSRLFLEWHTCLACIMKIYCIEYPKLYSDSDFLSVMLKNVFCTQENGISEKEFFSKYNCKQKTFENENCWLCEGLLQKSYVEQLKKAIMELINSKNYVNYEKYKLNIKIPLIYSLKYYVVCYYLWHQFNVHSSQDHKQQSPYKVSLQELKLIQTVLRVPYDKLGPKTINNPILEAKVVAKWLISNMINTETPLQSTIEELEDMLTINIEHEYQNFKTQDNLMKLFNHMVGLEKKLKSRNQRVQEKPQKKVKIDLSQQEDDGEQINEAPTQMKKQRNESFKCIANNVNKILYLNYEEIRHILDRFKDDATFFNLFNLDEVREIDPKDRLEYINYNSSVSRTIQLQTKNVCFSGKYCKYSRYLSQTPWIVNHIKLTQSSLQDQIQDQMLHYFYPSIPKEKIQTKFHSGGREDIDVRMLKGGRPFVLELVNPIKRLKDLNLQKIIEDSKLSKEMKQKIFNEANQIQSSKDKITYALEQIVNNMTELVQIKDFKEADESYISVQLKKAQIQKIKHYVCYIVSQEQLTSKDKEIVEKQYDLELDQKTPLRVLHRRTLLVRKKMIHKMYMHLVTKYSAIVEIWASAGTYIKQFIHGDLQRTLPNFGSLIGKSVDILQLDVGSLKQGNWEKDADLKMKFDHFDWKDE